MAGRISCELCQNEFPDDYLKIHMELHFQSMEKEYKCNVCQKIFYQERRLQIHSRMHKDNLKSCNVCSKSFRWSVSKSHMLKHTSINPSMCKLCPKSSLNYVDLNSHIRSVHNTQNLFPCFQCTKTFKDIKGVSLHISANHMEKTEENSIFLCALSVESIFLHQQISPLT